MTSSPLRPPPSSENSPLLTWEEVIALLRRHGQLLFLTAFFTSGIFFAIDARYPLTYSSSLILQVSNYTLGNSEQSNVQRLAQVLGGENQSVNNLAIDLTSQELLLPVIQELGLQVDVRPSGLIPWIQEMKELLYTNWRLLQGDSLYLPARADLPLAVREVTYRGDQGLSLVLTTQGTDGYLLREEDGTVLRGQWGAALSLSDGSTSFVIHWSDQPAQKMVSGQQYILTFVPSLYAWEGLQKSLKVTTSNGPNIYKLVYQSPYRIRASELLNRIASRASEVFRNTRRSFIEPSFETVKNFQSHCRDERGTLSKKLAEMRVCWLRDYGMASPMQTYQALLKDRELLDQQLRKSEREEWYVNALSDHSLAVTLSTLLSMNSHPQTQINLQTLARNRIWKSLSTEFSGGIDAVDEENSWRDLETSQLISEEIYPRIQGINQRLVHLSEEREKVNELEAVIERESFKLLTAMQIPQQPVVIELVQKCSRLILQLEEEAQRSTKEIERLQAQLALERHVLSTHLNEYKRAIFDEEKLLSVKRNALRSALFRAIERDERALASGTREQLDDFQTQFKLEYGYQRERQRELNRQIETVVSLVAEEEQQLAEKKLNEERLKWVSQSIDRLTLEEEMGEARIRVIDRAFPAFAPNSPKIIPITLLGIILGCAWGCCLVLYRGFSGRIPITRGRLVDWGMTPLEGEVRSETTARLGAELMKRSGEEPYVLLYLSPQREGVNRLVSYLKSAGSSACVVVADEKRPFHSSSTEPIIVYAPYSLSDPEAEIFLMAYDQIAFQYTKKDLLSSLSALQRRLCLGENLAIWAIRKSSPNASST